MRRGQYQDPTLAICDVSDSLSTTETHVAAAFRVRDDQPMRQARNSGLGCFADLATTQASEAH